jgi:hypothetical protein
VTIDTRPIARAPADSIDFGAEILRHLELSAGLFELGLGLWDRLMVGTDTLPWFAWTLADGSVIPNVFFKAKVFAYRSFSVALRSGIFYARLNDIDGDHLKVRAWDDCPAREQRAPANDLGLAHSRQGHLPASSGHVWESAPRLKSMRADRQRTPSRCPRS